MIILKYINPQPLHVTLRPIAAGPNCPTRRLSNLVDILLKSFLIHIKSYIKKTLIFLQNVLGKSNGIPFQQRLTLQDSSQIFPMNIA